jgi:hypothetical protein
MTEIVWKMGKETGNQKVEKPQSLKSNEMGEASFEPMQPFVVDTFKNCEGLGRVAIMEGASVIMLGKVTFVDFKEKVVEKKVEAGKPGEKGKTLLGLPKRGKSIYFFAAGLAAGFPAAGLAAPAAGLAPPLAAPGAAAFLS